MANVGGSVLGATLRSASIMQIQPIRPPWKLGPTTLWTQSPALRGKEAEFPIPSGLVPHCG